MDVNKLAKQVFCDLVDLSQQGFITWTTDALTLADDLGLDITSEKNMFSMNCEEGIHKKITDMWLVNLQNSQLYPLLRTYKMFKSNYIMEPYLFLVKKPRFRNVIARFRCKSHTLEIERGRQTNPQTPVAERVCVHCKVVEDETRFLLKCYINAFERQCFYEKISRGFDDEKFSFVSTSVNSQYLSWLIEFLYRSFEIRNEFAICRELIEAEWHIYAPVS